MSKQDKTVMRKSFALTCLFYEPLIRSAVLFSIGKPSLRLFFQPSQPLPSILYLRNARISVFPEGDGY